MAELPFCGILFIADNLVASNRRLEKAGSIKSQLLTTHWK
jgi:hypothetical protein